MPDRRTFLIACTGMVAAPAFARLGVSAAAADSPRAMVEPPGPILRIDGWESPVDSESVVWVHVNSSWRSTWR